MKNLRYFIAGILACLATAAQAQFIQGIQAFPLVSGLGGTNCYTVAASATTNIPTTDARVIVLGNNGFGVGIYSCAGGTSLATNTLVFESTADGVNWINTLPPLNVYVTNCTATPVAYYTNFATTTLGLANVMAVRLKYITNSSAQTTFWSNIVATVR